LSPFLSATSTEQRFELKEHAVQSAKTLKLDSGNEVIFIDVLTTKVLKQDSARIM